MKRREFNCLAATAGLLGLPALADAAPVAGTDYTQLGQPVPVQVAGKSEVIEFFGYWCPHCNAFEPMLEAWVAKLPSDVNFRRVPVAWSPMHVPYQKLYFALVAIGAPASINQKVFNAVHVQGLRFENPAAITQFASENGLDKQKLADAMNSFSIASQLARANQLFASYKVDGVPTLAVNGRYTTSPEQAKGETQALQVADALLRLKA